MSELLEVLTDLDDVRNGTDDDHLKDVAFRASNVIKRLSSDVAVLKNRLRNVMTIAGGLE